MSEWSIFYALNESNERSITIKYSSVQYIRNCNYKIKAGDLIDCHEHAMGGDSYEGTHWGRVVETKKGGACCEYLGG